MTTVTPEDLAAAVAAATAETPVQKQSAYAANVSANFFGVMNLVVDFVPAKLSSKVDMNIICPECDEAHSMAQRYVCTVDSSHQDANDEGLPGFAQSTAGRGTKINGTLVKVTEDEVTEIKSAQLPKNDLQVNVYTAAEVERVTRPSGTSYRLRPKGALPVYAMLVDLVADRSKAFIGEVNLRNQDKLFRIESWNGNLVATELARPTETAPADPITATYEPKLLSMASQLAEIQVESFDPDKFANSVKQRAAEFEAKKLAEGAAPAERPTKTKKPVDATKDLMAALEASLQKAKGA